MLEQSLDLEEKYKEFLVTENKFSNKVNFHSNKAVPIHGWFNYPQGFSSALVDEFIDIFNIKEDEMVLDPFCGVGTTAVVCKEKNINSINVDLSPLAIFIAKTKCNVYHVEELKEILHSFESLSLSNQEFPSSEYDILEKAFSKENYGKLMQLKSEIGKIEDQKNRDFFALGLISIMEKVSYIRKHGSHYRFINNDNPGVKHLHINGNLDKIDVKREYVNQVRRMASDLSTKAGAGACKTEFLLGDARKLESLVKDRIDFVVTSPPYLNRNNYIAQHKMELFFLDFVKDFEEYRTLTFTTFRSHVEARRIEALQDEDTPYLSPIIEVLKNKEMNNPKNLEMIRGYYADLDHFSKSLSRVINPETRLAVVLGNVRWAGISIPTDYIFAEICQKHGMKLEKIVVTRFKGNSPQQMKAYGRDPVRESIVMMRGA